MVLEGSADISHTLTQTNRLILEMKVLLIMAALFFTFSAQAQKISIDDARSKAAEFLSHSGKMKKVAAKGMKSKDLTLAKSNTDKIYVFNVGDNEGFVVVSGDSRTRSILGYGNGSGFDLESAPDNMKAWLKGYEAEIASLDGQEIAVRAATEPEVEPYGEAIEPLLKTKWNQSTPYNDQCPEWEGQRCFTGCVCTALAQVLYYWQAPKHWVATQPGYLSAEGAYSFYVPQKPATKFKWDDMCLTYTEENKTTAKQDSAVAELMSYCGQALKMGYTPNGSGTPEIKTVDALKEFGFSEKTRCVRRSQYTTKEWESMLYDNLKRKIPVPYTGTSDDSGHAFVCDGYAGNGMFHINWGWGGMADNYFVLSILNPRTNEGAGASTTRSGYNIEQMMVVDAEPVDYPVGEVPYLTSGIDYEMVKKDEASDSIGFEVINASARNGVFQMALATKGADGSLTPAVYCINMINRLEVADVPVNYPGYFVCSVSSAGLNDGAYDLYPVYKCVSVSGDTWKPLFREKYVHAVISNSSATVTLMPALALSIEKFENKGSGYALENQEFALTIHNDGETEHNSQITVKVKYEGDEQGANTQQTVFGGYIPVGASVPFEFFLTPTYHGNATVDFYSGQNGSTPFASIPIKISEQRKEFVEAYQVSNYQVQYVYNATQGLIVRMGVVITNIFSEDLVRDIEVIVRNNDILMQKSISSWRFPSNTTRMIQLDVNFTPSDIAAMNFSTDLSEGIDFFLASPLGKNYYPFFSLHVPDGYIATPNGYVTDIRDVYENDNEKAYSLTGIPVGEDYRGIVIKNGKKLIRR